eukprot:2081415-Rhodomonas_salina.1
MLGSPIVTLDVRKYQTTVMEKLGEMLKDECVKIVNASEATTLSNPLKGEVHVYFLCAMTDPEIFKKIYKLWFFCSNVITQTQVDSGTGYVELFQEDGTAHRVQIADMSPEDVAMAKKGRQFVCNLPINNFLVCTPGIQLPACLATLGDIQNILRQHAEGGSECIICFESRPLFVCCRHCDNVVCSDCSKTLKTCPICRRRDWKGGCIRLGEHRSSLVAQCEFCQQIEF